MGWLWMCLGLKSKSARRIGGRVSSDTYDSRLYNLSSQYDFTKTPRIEDFLDPRGAGYDVFVNGQAPESPTPIKKISSLGRYTDGKWEEDLLDGKHRTHEGMSSLGERIKGEYGPYWGYAEDMPRESFAFPRVVPSTRKSFSELLTETDTLDKGPVALQGEGHEKLAQTGVDGMEAYQQPPQSPQSPHSMPLLTPSSISSLSKDHLEASNAVAAFKESRRQARLAENASKDQPVSHSSYISSFFRSSRKRSLQFGSHPFQRSLSPVAESLCIDEELRRKSDFNLRQSFSSDLPKARGGSDGWVPSDDEEPTSKGMQPRDAESGKETLGAELGTEDVSEFLFTEEWDDYVLVEKVQESPTQRLKQNSEAVEAGPVSGSFIMFATGHRAEDISEKQVRDGRSPVEDVSNSSVNARILDGDLDSSASTSEVELALRQEDVTSPRSSECSSVRQIPTNNLALDSEGQLENDTLLSTPIRDPLVTPEVFISPRIANAELNFTRVMDIDPEERPIFGSLAEHWEVAWATKRPAWDGKGIPNSTHKYREDQKVMWHAAPFEERLAEALATQEAAPQRRNVLKGPTSRLASSRNARGLEAH